MDNSPSCGARGWLAVPAGIVSACAMAVAVFQTRVAWIQARPTAGDWHARIWNASAVALPVSILLFAFGVQWALRRRPELAIPALLPLPVWAACLLAVDSILATDCWIALSLMQLQGASPFGGT